MGTVVADMTMSVDGFIADPDDGVGPLFQWYSEGDVEFTFPGDGMQARVSKASAQHLERVVSELGALMTGRRLYDESASPPCSSGEGSRSSRGWRATR
jgi:hypothetical protein